jgi:hypothetical protein
MSKKGSFGKGKNSSFIIFCFLFPIKISFIIYYTNILIPWALCLCLPYHLFCLSHRKICWIMLVDNVGLKICLLRDLELHGHFDVFFYLSVNGSGPGTSSTTNHKFYEALGQLHGPRCKQPPLTPT